MLKITEALEKEYGVTLVYKEFLLIKDGHLGRDYFKAKTDG
jgi:hypothetical protein